MPSVPTRRSSARAAVLLPISVSLSCTGPSKDSGGSGQAGYQSSTGRIGRVTNQTSSTGAFCYEYAMLQSATPVACEACDYAFLYDPSESELTTCATNSLLGGPMAMGLGDYEGQDYVFYKYYDDWTPTFPVTERAGNYLYFYRYDAAASPYEYGGSTYYYTSVWGGYLTAYR